MSDIVFNEPKLPSESRVTYSYMERIARWIVHNSGGTVKDEKQAETLLTIVSVLILIISVYFIFFGGGPELPSGIKEIPPQGLPIN